MDEAFSFFIRHGGSILFWAVFAEQIGLPLPAIPFLLAAGALAGVGKMNPAAVIGLSVTACLIGDLICYELGHYRGRHVQDVPAVLVWNEEQLRNSTTKLLNYSFEWVLPGRGCCAAALRSANSQLSEETQ